MIRDPYVKDDAQGLDEEKWSEEANLEDGVYSKGNKLKNRLSSTVLHFGTGLLTWQSCCSVNLVLRHDIDCYMPT